MMKSPAVLTVIFILSIFQMILLKAHPFFGFLDEALTIWALFQIISKPLTNIHKKMMIIICILVIYGILCNFLCEIQTKWSVILNDIGNCFKVFITYIGSCAYFRNQMTAYRVRKFSINIINFLWLLIPIMFVCGLINIFYDIGMRHDLRHGFYSFRFIYDGSGDLAMLFYSIVFVFTIYQLFYRTKDKANVILMAMIFFVWLSTMRSRAFLFTVFYFIAYYYAIMQKKQIKINAKTVLFCIVLFILICADQASLYMENDLTARYNLLNTGIEIMKSYFPIGTGFGTYGTDVAAKNYSTLYYRYGLYLVWGLSPDDPQFAHDNYWPAIMGQFGLIGVIGFILLIYYLFKDMIKMTFNYRYLKLGVVFICFTQIVASFATAVFFHFVTVFLMFWVAMILSGLRNNILYNE